MRYLFFIFPAYLLYFSVTTYHKPEWGFGFLWSLEVIAIQVVVTGVVLLGVWTTVKPQLPAFGKFGIYALLASALIALLS